MGRRAVSFGETLRTALQGIQTHRLRSGLTMLGILIGIAAVILTVGLGQGAQKQVRDSIDKLGSHLLIVSPGSTTSSSGVRGGRGTASTLTTSDAVALSNHTVAPDIANVAPVASSSESVAAGTTNWTTSVVGTVPNWLDVRARSITEGRFITAADLERGTAGRSARDDDEFRTVRRSRSGRADRDHQWQHVHGGRTVEHRGILCRAGDEDDQVVVPQTTYADRVSTSGNRSSISTLYLEASSQKSLSAAYQEADNALNTLHGTSAATSDFTISSQQSLLSTATSTSKTLTVLLGGVAAISLLVGGLGVMNIMLVAVPSEFARSVCARRSARRPPRSAGNSCSRQAASVSPEACWGWRSESPEPWCCRIS